LTTSAAPIGNTAAPWLYDHERVGIRSIRVPLTSAGRYRLVLYFAETEGAEPGARVFNVVAQGRTVARHLNVARLAGPDEPFHLVFTVRAPKRLVTVRFVPVVGRPILSAFVVAPAGPIADAPATHLVWDDEFNGPRGSAPSRRRWTYDLGGRFGYGKELQYYTDRRQNASVDGHGHLLITARRETYRGPDGVLDHYTSARIKTQGRFAMLYGRAEARIKVPAHAHGLIADFWALGSNVNVVGFPQSGEIDPLEAVLSQPTRFIQALHMPSKGSNYQVVWHFQLPESLAAHYHTFGFEWDPGVVWFLVDGRQTASLTRADVPLGSFVFSHRFYLILNLTVKGWYGQPPNATTRWPSVMRVDWVRVWR